MSTVPEQFDEATLQTRLEEQKRLVARLVSEGKSAAGANAVLYRLSDALYGMRERKRTGIRQPSAQRTARNRH